MLYWGMIYTLKNHLKRLRTISSVGKILHLCLTQRVLASTLLHVTFLDLFIT